MNITKKDKKGFLLAEETLKTLIAVICIVFLIYLLVAIYNSSTSEKKIVQAKDALFGDNGIANITFSLKDGESQRKDILDPSGWHIYSFVGAEKPNLCTNERCLCICDKALVKLINSQAEKCDKAGACFIIPNLAASEVDLKITGSNPRLFIEIKKQNNKIFVEKSI